MSCGDKHLLTKYAKNWLYLSRAFQEKEEWNESLTCLLPATSLFLLLSFSHYLTVILAEAYSSFLMIVTTKKNAYSTDHLKNIE